MKSIFDVDLATWRWLAGPIGTTALSQTSQLLRNGGEELRILAGLRRSYGSNLATATLEQAKLRGRAEQKFPHASQMLFTVRGLAQASGHIVAQYKASRFSDGPTIDACCGIGGDLIALAARGETTGIDRDRVMAFCANFNAESLGATSVRVVCSDVESFGWDHDAAIHLDPDRRPGPMRTVDLNFYSPNGSAIESIIDCGHSMSLKLAPATSLPESWYSRHEVEWIGHRSECKQQVVWTATLAKYPARRTATVISNDGSIHERIVQSDKRIERPRLGEVSKYLLDPHAAVLAAGLANELANQFNANRISDGVAYLTADRKSDSQLASWFEVLEVVPLRRGDVESAVRALDVSIVEVKTRGLARVDLHDFSGWKRTGSQNATLVLTRIAGRPRAILSRRCELEAVPRHG